MQWYTEGPQQLFTIIFFSLSILLLYKLLIIFNKELYHNLNFHVNSFAVVIFFYIIETFLPYNVHGWCIHLFNFVFVLFFISCLPLLLKNRVIVVKYNYIQLLFTVIICKQQLSLYLYLHYDTTTTITTLTTIYILLHILLLLVLLLYTSINITTICFCFLLPHVYSFISNMIIFNIAVS